MKCKNSLALVFILSLFQSILHGQSTSGQATAQLTVSVNIVASVSIAVTKKVQPRVISANAADPVNTFGKISPRLEKAQSVSYHIPARRQEILATEEPRTFIHEGEPAELKTTTVLLK